MSKFLGKSVSCVFGRSRRMQRLGVTAANTLHNVASLFRGSRCPAQRFQILLYHRVIPEPDPFAIDTITLDEFESHVRILSEHFYIRNVRQLLHDLDRDVLRPDTVCITFDDGYRDNYLYAYPVLRKYQATATVFLTTGVIGNQRMPWYDRVLRAVRETRKEELLWHLCDREIWPLQSLSDRLEFAFQLLDDLKTKHPRQRDQQIDTLLEACDLNPDNVQRQPMMLTWEEVKEMHHHGIDFGAHSVNHPILSLLNDGEIFSEIVESKRQVEEKLNIQVESFAYPNGRKADYNERVKDILKKCGFRCGLTTNWGLNTRQTDRFEWCRCRPWLSEPAMFFAQLLKLRVRATLMW